MYGHPNQQAGPYGSVAPPPPGPFGGGYGMGGPQQGPPRPPQPMNMMNGPAQPSPQPGGFSAPPIKRCPTTCIHAEWCNCNAIHRSAKWIPG